MVQGIAFHPASTIYYTFVVCNGDGVYSSRVQNKRCGTLVEYCGNTVPAFRDSQDGYHHHHCVYFVTDARGKKCKSESIQIYYVVPRNCVHPDCPRKWFNSSITLWRGIPHDDYRKGTMEPTHQVRHNHCSRHNILCCIS